LFSFSGNNVQDGMLQKAGYISIHDMEVQKDEHGAMVKTGNQPAAKLNSH